VATDIAIQARNISKAYKIYSKPIDMLKELLTQSCRHEVFWALRDVSFELNRGEMIAFIGRNGAGKSTLLKIIAGTLDQTSGKFEINGRVASILELGTGFNPEYTGLENIKLGGLCLGLSQREVDEKLDWIIDFSELSQFINRPFKTYSSGMQARLTFATAACMEPEVLIVDEALSVGDIKFQVKCFDRLREFRKKGGTILLVSHDLNTINAFCNRAFWIEQGRVVSAGEPREITTQYYNFMFNLSDKKSNEISQAETGDSTKISKDEDGSTLYNPEFIQPPLSEKISKALKLPVKLGDGLARIVEYGVFTINGKKTNIIGPGNTYVFHVRIYAKNYLKSYQVGIAFKDTKGVVFYGTGTHTQKITPPALKPNEVRDFFFRVRIPCINYPFLVSMGIAHNESNIIDQCHDCLVLTTEADSLAFPNSYIHVESEIMIGKSWDTYSTL
jgi:ABC-type polysaccharide/polyol phosphate transport system ATPase subunit